MNRLPHMKILKLIVDNYQSHVHTELDFSGHMDLIIGSSDAGKSTIIRSMLSLLFKDKFYLRNGTTNGYVEVHTDDGTVLRRQKTIKDGVTTDKYILNGTVFRKIGKQIPKQIVDAIKIHLVELNDGSMLNLNVQTQHGGKFLLSDTEYSAGFRARVTSLSGSETLDRASLAASTEYRATKSSITEATDKTLPRLNADLSLHQELLTINDKYKELKLKHDSILRKYDDLDKIKELYSKLSKLNFTTIDYSNTLDKINNVINNLSILLNLNKLNSISKSIIIPQLPSTKKVDDLYMWIITLRELYTTHRSIQKLYMKNMSHSSLLTGWTKQYEELMNSEENCPLCELPLRSSTRHGER